MKNIKRKKRNIEKGRGKMYGEIYRGKIIKGMKNKIAYKKMNNMIYKLLE